MKASTLAQGVPAGSQKRNHQVLNFYMGAQRVAQTMGPNSLRVLSAQTMSLALRPVSDLDNHVELLQTDLPSSVIGVTQPKKTHSQAFTPYGFCNQPNTRSQPAFNGQWVDALLGGYFLGNGYRFYNTAIMRFHSPDTMSPFGKGGVNAYAYCQGDPVNNQDPTGHAPGAYIKNYGPWMYDFRNGQNGDSNSPATLKDTLDANSTIRLNGYYFEAETRTAVEFRAKSMYAPGEYRKTLGMSNNFSRNSSGTHFSLEPETFKAGRFMLKGDIALSGISTNGQPATFESLAPYRDELIALGFQETTINANNETGHRVTAEGFIQNRPKPKLNAFEKFKKFLLK